MNALCLGDACTTFTILESLFTRLYDQKTAWECIGNFLKVKDFVRNCAM